MQVKVPGITIIAQDADNITAVASSSNDVAGSSSNTISDLTPTSRDLEVEVEVEVEVGDSSKLGERSTVIEASSPLPALKKISASLKKLEVHLVPKVEEKGKFIRAVQQMDVKSGMPSKFKRKYECFA